MGRSYTVVGFGGSINDFTDVRYPAMAPNGESIGDTRNCLMCHNSDPTSGSTAYNLPMGKNAVTDPQGHTNPDRP
jgi:hypothetical protein